MIDQPQLLTYNQSTNFRLPSLLPAFQTTKTHQSLTNFISSATTNSKASIISSTASTIVTDSSQQNFNSATNNNLSNMCADSIIVPMPNHTQYHTHQTTIHPHNSLPMQNSINHGYHSTYSHSSLPVALTSTGHHHLQAEHRLTNLANLNSNHQSNLSTNQYNSFSNINCLTNNAASNYYYNSNDQTHQTTNQQVQTNHQSSDHYNVDPLISSSPNNLQQLPNLMDSNQQQNDQSNSCQQQTQQQSIYYQIQNSNESLPLYSASSNTNLVNFNTEEFVFTNRHQTTLPTSNCWPEMMGLTGKYQWPLNSNSQINSNLLTPPQTDYVNLVNVDANSTNKDQILIDNAQQHSQPQWTVLNDINDPIQSLSINNPNLVCNSDLVNNSINNQQLSSSDKNSINSNSINKSNNSLNLSILTIAEQHHQSATLNQNDLNATSHNSNFAINDNRTNSSASNLQSSISPCQLSPTSNMSRSSTILNQSSPSNTPKLANHDSLINVTFTPPISQNSNATSNSDVDLMTNNLNQNQIKTDSTAIAPYNQYTSKGLEILFNNQQGVKDMQLLFSVKPRKYPSRVSKTPVAGIYKSDE